MQPTMVEDPAGEGLFYLKCNNFSKLVSSQYEMLRNAQTLTDITFICDGRRLEAHKLVLYACSPYFRTLIEEELGAKHLVFFFNDIKYEIMKAILDYIYCGEVHIQNDYLKDFIRVAEKLCIRGLVRDDGGAAAKDAPDVEQQAEKRQRLEDGVAVKETSASSSSVAEVGQALCSVLAGKGTQEMGNIQVEYTEVHEENTLMPSLKSEATHWMEENLDTTMDGGGPKSVAPSGGHHSDGDDGRPGTSSKRISNCMTPATCNICGRVYSNASNLKQHHRLIHNPAPVICPICKKHYSSNLYLKRHFNAVHGQGTTQKHEEWEMFDASKHN